MAALPDGYELRSPTIDDVDAVAAVLLADDVAETGDSVYDADFVRAQWSTPGFDPEDDAWSVVDRDGATIGYANVTPYWDTRLKSWGVVHPEHRGLGIGSALLDIIEARAKARLAGVADAVLEHAINDVDEAARAMVRSRGYAFVRTFRHMQIDLDGPHEAGEPPAGIEIRGIDPLADLARAHAIFVEAFADEWGYRVIPFEEWRGNEVDIPGFDPTLWFLATEQGRPVGALNAILGEDRGWIGELGVLRPWRGRGIGSALLRRAFATFASRGVPRVMLNVDSENTTGAVRLYTRVGMRPVRGFDVYEKPVG